MNRRLFVGQLVAGASFLSNPSLPITRSSASSSIQPNVTAITDCISPRVLGGSVGTIQHVALSHVYSPEHTSLATLVAMVQKDMATLNTLLGTDFTVADRTLLGGGSATFGTYSTHFEKSGVKITWQGLARIGGEAQKPAVKLSIYGSKGIVQACSASGGYHFIDWQGRTTQLESQFSQAAKRMGRRRFLAV